RRRGELLAVAAVGEGAGEEGDGEEDEGGGARVEEDQHGEGDAAMGEEARAEDVRERVGKIPDTHHHRVAERLAATRGGADGEVVERQQGERLRGFVEAGDEEGGALRPVAKEEEGGEDVGEDRGREQ